MRQRADLGAVLPRQNLVLTAVSTPVAGRVLEIAGRDLRTDLRVTVLVPDSASALREHGRADAVAAGDLLQDFTLPDANGEDVSLSELVADGPGTPRPRRCSTWHSLGELGGCRGI